MPDHRKPPFEKGSRHDGAPLPSDSGGFSIETTTMRLKSLSLRRSDVADTESKPAASAEDTSDKLQGGRPSGRVRHDERGMAVWDWAVASGEFHTLSATSALKKLEVVELKIEETARVAGLAVEASSRDKGGGFDPYNQRDKKEKKK